MARLAVDRRDLVVRFNPQKRLGALHSSIRCRWTTLLTAAHPGYVPAQRGRVVVVLQQLGSS